MARLALHLNDAALTAVSDTRIVYREPGYALMDDDSLVTGMAAFAESRRHPRSVYSRHWRKLSLEPLAEVRFRGQTAADLAARQLETLWRPLKSAIDAVQFAVPVYFERAALGVLLGIAEELEMPVAGLVYAPVAATRREYPGRVPVHVDLSLHAALLSRLAQEDDAARLERHELVDEAGVVALHGAWIAVIAEAFVRQSRFDPLHTAESEQLLLDRLTAWLEAAGRDKAITMEVDFDRRSHRATIETVELVAAAAPTYQLIANRLRALIKAGEIGALQFSHGAAAMPGLVDYLVARSGGDAFMLEAGAAARGALARMGAPRGGDPGERRRLLRALPWDLEPAAPPAEQGTVEGETASHLLRGHRAYAIGERALVVGTDPEAGERSIVIDAGATGVSRRHCSIERANGQCVVTDYSRYGTFLNGNRIEESAILQPGDTLRVGTPGEEFQIITVVELSQAGRKAAAEPVAEEQ